METALDIQIARDILDAPEAQSLQLLLEDCLVALAEVVPDALESKLSQELCLRLCSEAESQELNNTFRNKDKPTNILSFGLLEEGSPVLAMPEQDLPLGDLALCWPVAIQEAQQQGKDLGHHVSHLFLHGVLHLLGFDHEGADEAEVMEQFEIQALALLSIADPYLEQNTNDS